MSDIGMPSRSFDATGRQGLHGHGGGRFHAGLPENL